MKNKMLKGITVGIFVALAMGCNPKKEEAPNSMSNTFQDDLKNNRQSTTKLTDNSQFERLKQVCFQVWSGLSDLKSDELKSLLVKLVKRSQKVL